MRKFRRPAPALALHTNVNLETKEHSHWDRIKSTGPEVCFVCDKKFVVAKLIKIRKNKEGNKNKKNKPIKHRSTLLIGKHKITGEELWRHESCDCCSENWKEKFHGVNTLSRTY